MQAPRVNRLHTLTTMASMIIPQPGMWGWLKELNPYPLPEGWSHRQPVEVIAINLHVVRVRAEDGRELDVRRINIDCGTILRTPTGEYPEWDPRAREHLQEHLETWRANPASDPELFEYWTWVYERSGGSELTPPKIS